MKTFYTRCVSHGDCVSPLIVAAAVVIAATISGCGSGEAYAPVSGTVTLNGDALADAKLIFEPIGDKDGQTLGKPSYGKTDAEGQFTLKCPIAEVEGAAIGEHRVRIVTTTQPEPTEKQKQAARDYLIREDKKGGVANPEITEKQIEQYLSDVLRTTGRESLPARYNTKTELRFTVADSDTNVADFDLKTP